MPTKRAKRRTLTWHRRGKPIASRVPVGSLLQRVRFGYGQKSVTRSSSNMEIPMDTNEISSEVEKEKTRAMRLKNENEKAQNKLEQQVMRINTEKEQAVKELEQQITEIEKPYDRRLAALNKRLERLRHAGYKFGDLERTAPIRAAYRADRSEEFSSADSFNGFMLSKDIRLRDVVKIEKKLPNGVTLFRHSNGLASDAGSVAYFAVKGRNIVGFHFTRKAEHIGDYPSHWAWINAKLLRHRAMIPATSFTGWKASIGKIRKFVPIEMRDKKNRKVLEEDYYISSEDIGERA